MDKVTDPALLERLNGGEGQAAGKVTDPGLLSKLNVGTSDPGFSASKMVGNAPRSALNFGKGVAHTVAHPIETIDNASSLLAGTVENVADIHKDSPNRAMASKVWSSLKDRYGSTAAAKKALQDDPIGVLADLSTVLTGGESALARIGARTAGAAGTVARVASGAAHVAARVTNPLTTIGAVARGARGVARAGGGGIAAAARRLRDAGVDITPGQATGGLGKRVEEASKSIPIAGHAVRAAERRSLEQFNRATVNEALEPIAARAPRNMTGRALIEWGQQALDRAYAMILPRVTLNMGSTGLISDLHDIWSRANELPAGQAERFRNIMHNRFARATGSAAPHNALPNPTPSGIPSGITLTGRVFKDIESELGHVARGMSNPEEHGLGDLIREVTDAMRDHLEQQNPAHAHELQRVNNAYAAFVRVEGAATRRATSTGLFTTGDLLQAIKATDRSARKRAFARGDALMQDWADDAHSVMANVVPDSGTAERAGLIGTATAGYTGLVSVPHAAMGGAALAGAYSPWSISLMNRLARRPVRLNPAVRAAIPAADVLSKDQQ